MAVKRVQSMDDMAKLPTTPGYKAIITFLNVASDSVKGKKLSDTSTLGPRLEAVLGVLEEVVRWSDEIPLEEKCNSRFGNKAFRVWHARLVERSPALVHGVLTAGPDAQPQWLEYAEELRAYLHDSFGNPTRIDYGTGHELHFLCFLMCLFLMESCSKEDLQGLVLVVWQRYMVAMRRLQERYSHEPAGSKGVYGLDDYHHLPFLFGAAQLVGNKEGLRPSDVVEPAVVEQHAAEYMYIAGIQWIMSQKRGHFAEHSPTLYDISGVAEWAKVLSGMVKMYQGEVLGKFPIVQHLLFGRLIPFD
eukprot:EG_transcript_16548